MRTKFSGPCGYEQSNLAAQALAHEAADGGWVIGVVSLKEHELGDG